MNKEKGWYPIRICPATKDPVSDDMIWNNGGVCNRCGNATGLRASHYESIIVRRSNISKWWWQPKQYVFEGKGEYDVHWLKSRNITLK